MFSYKALGNFYIVEAGGNGFAARKQKKIHPKGRKQIKHFCPRALARGQKCFICFWPTGWIFFLLKGGKTISTQLNFIEIAFLYEYYYDPEILFQEYLHGKSKQTFLK